MSLITQDLVLDETALAKEKITTVVGGQLLPLAHAPLLTSATTSWAGFLLEIHSAGRVRKDWWRWYYAHVCSITSGTLCFRVRSNGRTEEYLAQAGSALIFPSGFGELRFLDQSDFQLICVALDPAHVARLLGRKGPAATGALNPQFSLRDPHIGALLTNMAAEVTGGCLAGKLYGQTLSLTLAAYLDGKFSPFKYEKKGLPRRFSEQQICYLVDYIHNNLAHDLSLSHLSDLIEMSPRQFLRLFANTFGSTPHRYVMKERVARAKELLLANMSLVEISNTLGFASQSHFTVVFRRITGLSPGRFRRT